MYKAERCLRVKRILHVNVVRNAALRSNPTYVGGVFLMLVYVCVCVDPIEKRSVKRPTRDCIRRRAPHGL